jgi:hypothetical protein
MTRAGLALIFLVGCSNNNTVTSSSATKACVTATACGLVAGGVSQCTANALAVNNPLVAAVVYFSPQIVNCVAAAGSNCDNARKCLNGGQTPAACTGTSQACMGTVRTSCMDLGGGGNMTTQFDCGDIAQMCVVNTAGTVASCGYGTCAGASTMCTGTKVQSCSNGIVEQADCADFGSTCVVGALGNAHCRGTGATCQSTLTGDLIGNPLRCDGTVLVRCADSMESKFDCSSQNQKCVANVNNEAFGCALGSDCETATFSATCAANKLTYCNDGIISTFDCGSVGFKGCSPDGGGKCTT